MRKLTYKELYENEEKYWWFVGTREIIFDQLEKHLDIKKKHIRYFRYWMRDWFSTI